MKINVKAVLQREAERKAEVKPLPKLVIRKLNDAVRKPATPIEKEKITPALLSEKDTLLKDLWTEFTPLKKQRAHLSSQIYNLVLDVTATLHKESPATAQAFTDGHLPVPEIKEHYNKIQALTTQLTAIWDKIRYVEQYGVLPSVPVKNFALSESPEHIKSLNYEIRRLGDRVCKTNAKILKANTGLKKPKNSERIGDWRQKIAYDEARITELKHELKKLQYEARAQRIG